MAFPLDRSCVASTLLVCLVTLSTNNLNAENNPAQAQHFKPGERVVADSHNCYPYNGRWNDRIDRALSGGLPVAIEQDLHWYTPQDGGPSRSVVAHEAPLSGNEPGMEQYFFDRVRPIVESALANPDHSQWPILTLNLDVKTEQPEHLRSILRLLQKYKPWLTTAPKTKGTAPEPLQVGPILVLNGPSDIQQQIFYDELPVGGTLVTFGAVHTKGQNPEAPPSEIETEVVTNYRRWWNNPWEVIESKGQAHAGAWTAQANQRLEAFVSLAHQRGLWIRFYTLDGVSRETLDTNGWSANYNFSSVDAVKERWKASIEDGVDFIATDEYELLADMISATKRR